jgi:hypothetical protein
VDHVSSRGNGRAEVFLSDGDRQRLLGRLQLTVSRHFGIDPGVLSSHGHHVGPAKAVAVSVASRLTEVTGGPEIRARADRRDPHGLAHG